MFEALGRELDGDHLDLTFRDTGDWPRVGPDEGMPPSLWISLGDPVSGPGVQLGAFKPPPMEQDLWLDTHYHGSDQFRALLQGKFLLQGKHMTPGQFVYQEAGRPYREGIVAGCDDEMWIFAVHGDRRGARATLVRHDGTFALDESQIGEDQLDRYVSSPDDPYWADIPGGSKGVPAVATTLQPDRAVYIWGSFDDAASWRTLSDGVTATAASFGNAETGPVMLTVHGDPGRVVLPALASDTEVVCLLMRGEADIGGKRYRPGEMRVQKAGAPLDPVVSGPDGADVLFMIADRRAKPRVAGDDAASRTWKTAVDSLYAELAAA